MFGKLLGNLIAAPIRLANVPVKILDSITDPNGDAVPLSERDPLALEEIADAVADAVDFDD